MLFKQKRLIFNQPLLFFSILKDEMFHYTLFFKSSFSIAIAFGKRILLSR